MNASRVPQQSRSSAAQSPVRHSCNGLLLTALTLSSVTVLNTVAPAVANHSLNEGRSPTNSLASEQLAQASPKPANLSLTEGTYLYGESAQPEQIGKAYTVFEVNQNRVVGAVYMPRSSFDCFHGTIESGQLALTIRDSYDQTTHPYNIALERQFPNTASRDNPASAVVTLEGFQKLRQLSDNDRRILGVCKVVFPH